MLSAGLASLLDTTETTRRASGQPQIWPFRAAVRSRGTLDPQIVESLLVAAKAYRLAYHSAQAAPLLQAAKAHLDLVLSLNPAGRSDNERLPLLTALGETAALAAVIIGIDAMAPASAEPYLKLAWDAARATDDIDLMCVLLGGRAFLTAYGRGDHGVGLRYADDARELGADRASPQTRAWVAAIASERCASLGDEAGCQQRLDESRRELESTVGADIPWRGIGGYDCEKLAAYAGGNYMRLHQYGPAEDHLTRALDRLSPTMARHRATAFLHRARARLGLGDVSAACDDARHALARVTELQHTAHLRRLTAIAARCRDTGTAAGAALYRDVKLALLDAQQESQ